MTQDIFDDETGTSVEITGSVKSIHQYVDMPKEKITVTLSNGTATEVQGCLPAMGYSFGGGTTDGPAVFDFFQSELTDNPFWNAIRDLVFPPPEDQIECHAPKPILIYTGGVRSIGFKEIVESHIFHPKLSCRNSSGSLWREM